MKTLLLRPPISSKKEDNIKSDILKAYFLGHELELGLLYIASYLESKDKDVNFFDMSLYNNPYPILKKILNTYKPDIVGLTAYMNGVVSAQQVVKFIKENSKAYTIIGGAHASTLPKETLQDCSYFDFVVVGDGEYVMLDLIKTLEKGSNLRNVKSLTYRDIGEIKSNPIREPIKDLDSLPFPARHLTEFKKYIPPLGNYHKLPSTALVTARGCPHHCTFCARADVEYKRMLRLRSVDNVLAEMEHCMKTYNTYDFRFYDDTFVIPRERLIEFCKRIIEKKWKISWNSYARVDAVDEKLLKLMRKSGCYHLKYGIEVGSDEWLKKIKKGTTVEQAKKAIKLTKKMGIATKASFIIGLPNEKVEDIKRTIKLAKEITPLYASFTILHPLPGSELFNEAVKNGKLLHRRWDEYFQKSSRILSNQLDINTLQKLTKKAYRQVYFSPKYIITRLNYLIRNFNYIEFRNNFIGLKILLEGIS